MAAGSGGGRGALTRGAGAGAGTRAVVGAGGGGGAGGLTFGVGGAMNSLSNSAGTTNSCTRCTRPDCSAHRAAPCKASTAPTINVVRRGPPAGAKRSTWDIKEGEHNALVYQEMQANKTRKLVAKDPPGRPRHEDHAAWDGDDEIQRRLSRIQLAGRRGRTSASLRRAATGRDGLHWATTSRAHPSQHPHWVATPSSNWISAKLMPARAWRAISRSEIRRQTQTIMAVVTEAENLCKARKLAWCASFETLHIAQVEAVDED